MPTKYNTGNAVGSADPRDLYDNSVNIDEWANSQSKNSHPDRFGAPRRTWRGMENDFDAAQELRTDLFNDAQALRTDEFDADQDAREAQFVQLMISGGYTGTGADGAIQEYAPGIEVTLYKQIIRENGEFWRPAADTVLPYTTTGAGMPEGGAFVNIGDGLLRHDLVQPVATFNNVADMKGTVGLDVGRKARTLGYYESGDGGGNDYEIVAAGTGTDDGGSFIDLSGSGVQAKGLFLNGFNLEQFNVIGDGANDDTSQIQAAIDYVNSVGGGELQGRAFAKYKIDVNTIEIKPYVVLIGLPEMINVKSSIGGAPSYEVYTGKGSTTTPAFLIKANASIKGFTFNYPEQVDADLRDPVSGTILSAPIEYGYTIQTTGGNYPSDRISIKDLMLYNSYLGIDFDRGGQSVIERIYGQPIKTGLRCEQWRDIINVENVHFWPFNVPTKATDLGQWTLNNGTSFLIGNVDGPTFKSCFSFGYKTGIHLTDFGNGAPWVHWVGGGVDWSKNPLYIEKSSLMTTFSDCFLIGDDGVRAEAITTSDSTGAESVVSFSNVGVWNVFNGANIKSDNGTFNFVNFKAKGNETTGHATGNDVKMFGVINQGYGATVSVANSPRLGRKTYEGVSGCDNTIIDGVRAPKKGADITSSLPGFSDMSSNWTFSGGFDSAVTTLANGYRVNLSDTNISGVSVAKYVIPDLMRQESGFFILEFNIEATEWELDSSATFQFRINSIAHDTHIAPFAGNPAMHGWKKTRLQIPLIIPPLTSEVRFQWLLGDGYTGSAKIDITDVKMYRSDRLDIDPDFVNIVKGTRKWISTDNIMPLSFERERRITSQGNVPTAGRHELGDTVYKRPPLPGSPVGWVCTESGSPGVWKAMASLAT